MKYFFNFFAKRILLFAIKETKLVVLSVSLSGKDEEKLLNFLSKSFERSVFYNQCKIKSVNKDIPNEYIYFVTSNFVGSIILFVLSHSNEVNNGKNLEHFYLSRKVIKNYSVIINGKNFYDKPIDSNIKLFK